MSIEEEKPIVHSGGPAGRKDRRVGRRSVIKAGVATAAGLALAGSYVKPGVVSAGVQESYTPSGDVPPPSPPPVSAQGCSPGFWGRSPGGRGLWDVSSDPNWNAVTHGDQYNPYTHDTLFNSYFTPVAGLSGLTMIDLVGSGGTSNRARQAARDLVAAYLNACIGLNYAYSKSGLMTMWNAAVSSGDFGSFHDQVGDANGSSCPLPNSW